MIRKTNYFFLSLFSSALCYGQCPGYVNARDPRAATNILVSGSTPWQLCQQVYVSDNVYCGRSSFPVGTTQYLYVYDWGFSAFSGSATICGIKIRMERSQDPANSSDVTDLEMRLWNGSALSPNNYADPNPWPTADTYITYGGNSDLWGWGSITPAQINSVAFGLRFRAQSAVGANIAYIDHIEMTGHSDEVLPVTLLAFDALKDIKKHLVYFKWKCASETNNSYFTIERSRDNLTWEKVERVAGAGNSSLETNYESTDAEPFPGTSYYRLSQTDYDGTTKVLDLLSVRFKNYLADVMVYPSLATEYITVRSKSDISRSEIIISDATGRPVRVMQLNGDVEIFETPIDISGLAPGLYIVKIMSDDIAVVRKFVKN